MDAMSPEGTPQPVRIAWRSPYLAPTVLLGGDDQTPRHLITEATRVTVDCEAGTPPKIYLEFANQPSVEDLDLEGVVYVTREIPADPLLAVQEFLDALDPDEMNKAVLELMEFSLEEESFASAALKVLRGWARGDQPGGTPT